MKCVLCGSEDHPQEFHDTEILNWFSEGTKPELHARAYYAYKRREKKNYPGIRADAWWMMHNSVHMW